MSYFPGFKPFSGRRNDYKSDIIARWIYVDNYIRSIMCNYSVSEANRKLKPKGTIKAHSEHGVVFRLFSVSQQSILKRYLAVGAMFMLLWYM